VSLAVPFDYLATMLGHEFIRNAFVGGTAIALATGLVGYFVVLRNQVFAGDALSHVAFTGSVLALLVGVDLRLGLFVTTVAVAVGLSVLQVGNRAGDVVVGTAFAWVLGIGALALSIYTSSRSTQNSSAGVHVLFGSIFGLNAGAAQTAVLIALGAVAAMLLIARPLLFATIDPDVARVRGVPSRLVVGLFLAVVGVSVGEATQAVGALPLLGLLATPAATAQRLTTRPWLGMWVSAAVAVGSLWVGLTLSYAAPKVPPTFAIVSVAFTFYLLVRAFQGAAAYRRRGISPRLAAAASPLG
jgi:zinc/manganese transport system permease protein